MVEEDRGPIACLWSGVIERAPMVAFLHTNASAPMALVIVGLVLEAPRAFAWRLLVRAERHHSRCGPGLLAADIAREARCTADAAMGAARRRAHHFSRRSQ
jgi:hypothetical protein